MLLRGVLLQAITAVLLVQTVACKGQIAGGEADGPKIFAQVCARCHGGTGEPNASMVARYGVKSLRSERVNARLSDDDIRKQILRGSENKQMPSFQGALSDEQLAALIAHVRSLSASSSAAPQAPPQ